jgi:hypothetical protein
MRGGWLAIKGIVVAFAFAVLAVAATRDSTNARPLAMILAYGSGTAFIVSNLRQWKKNNKIIKGASISWTVALVLLVFCLVTFTDVFSRANRNSSSVGSTASEIVTVPPPDPKETLLSNVRLDFQWHKDGFGNVMIADFTVKNPTQFRFKDFEIKCTHSAASGTVIDSNTRTIYEIVEPKSAKVIKEMNMGFIDSQVASSSCEITDLVPLQ